MSIKKQLAAYYDKQGLTGKHRRKAMQWDMRATREEVRRKQETYGYRPTCLFQLGWSRMPQPTQYYWARRDLCL